MVRSNLYARDAQALANLKYANGINVIMRLSVLLVAAISWRGFYMGLLDSLFFR